MYMGTQSDITVLFEGTSVYDTTLEDKIAQIISPFKAASRSNLLSQTQLCTHTEREAVGATSIAQFPPLPLPPQIIPCLHTDTSILATAIYGEL